MKNKNYLLLCILLCGCNNLSTLSSDKISSLSNTLTSTNITTSSNTSTNAISQSSNSYVDLTSSSINSVTTSINTNSVANSTTSLTTSNVSSSSTSSSNVINTSSVLSSDPYENITREQFYLNYKEASSYEDAMYRTKHGLISGSIKFLDKEPQKNTIYSGDDFLKFNNYSYGYDENNNVISYNINTKEGTYKTIYYNAGYVALEEVAAYIFAFGEVPPNSNYAKGSSGKKASINEWGKYGRVNVGNYSNDVSRYPNEPELPVKDSNNKYYQYIETDFGLEDYNDGSYITRGTYRIVFTGKYKDGSNVTDINERHVFYTYNHYEDFEEYLNYYQGWGDRFGYETSNYTTPTSYRKAVIVDKNSLN